MAPERPSPPATPTQRILFVMAAEQEYGRELRRRISPLITGVGPIEAAIGTTSRLQQLCGDPGRRPELVVSLGSAASARHELGSVWQVRSVSWRDMDATRVGFERGVTPFADHPAVIPLPTPIDGLATATLSTGAAVVGGAELESLSVDLADMETFAVVRVCARFEVPVIGLRAVSDGQGDLADLAEWEDAQELVDAALAGAVDRLLAAESRPAGG